MEGILFRDERRIRPLDDGASRPTPEPGPKLIIAKEVDLAELVAPSIPFLGEVFRLTTVAQLPCITPSCGDFVQLSRRQLLQRPRIAVRIAEGDEGAPQLNVHLARFHTVGSDRHERDAGSIRPSVSWHRIDKVERPLHDLRVHLGLAVSPQCSSGPRVS